jgi:hypothetical protein
MCSLIVRICKGMGQLLTFVVALPFVLIFLTLWLVLTLTGIGPLLQYCYNRRDKALLAACTKPAPGAVVDLVQVSGNPCRLAVRWSPGKNPDLPPVCIPNGLGATLITIAGLHDMLEEAGYPVLSYDRTGVGLSDPWPKGAGTHAGPAAVIADMKCLMDMYGPRAIGGPRKWILIGPSMGSIVAQGERNSISSIITSSACGVRGTRVRRPVCSHTFFSGGCVKRLHSGVVLTPLCGVRPSD